jgi:metal-responsive CopG/Arc/MetJ family transcriptional regulator
MAKIAVSIPDSLLKKIDDQSNTKGITRSKYVAIALDLYAEGANNYKTDIDKLNTELAEKTKELESLSIEVLPLREKVHTIENILAESNKELNSRANEVFLKEKKIHTLENQLADKDKEIKSLSKEVLLQKDEGMKIRIELEKAKLEATKYEMAFKSQQADLDFLRGHVSQLTQSISQLALKPGDEEVKKKGWLRFWRRD